MQTSPPINGSNGHADAALVRTRRLNLEGRLPAPLPFPPSFEGSATVSTIDTPEFRAKRAAASFLVRANHHQINQLSVADPENVVDWETISANVPKHDAASGPRNWLDATPLELAVQLSLVPMAAGFARLCRETQRNPFDLDFFMRAPKPSPMLDLPFALVPVGGFAHESQIITMATCVPYIDYLLPASWKQAIATAYKRKRVAFVYCPPDSMRRYIESYGGPSKFEVFTMAWPDVPTLPNDDAKIQVPKALLEDSTATPFIDVQLCQPRDEALEIFPVVAQTQRRMIPVFGNRAAGLLTLACAAIPDVQKKGEIRNMYGAATGAHQSALRIFYVLGDADQINSVVARGESARVDTNAIIRRLAEQAESKGNSTGGVGVTMAEIDMNTLVAASKGESDDADFTASMLLQCVLAQGIDWGANDVIISAAEHPPTKSGEDATPYTWVRYKVDGRCRDHASNFPASLAPLLINTVKVAAGINPGRMQKGMDGAFSVRYSGIRWDLRVNVQNNANGEFTTMRLQNASVPIRTFEQLGMRAREIQILINAGNRAVGFMVICGATGAGKSNTIWRWLMNLDLDTKNVITLEEPVERKLDRVQQVPIGTNEYNTFVEGLRAALREAPDIIGVGETRDLATMEACLTACATGHFVSTTLHANTACSAPGRLLNMGEIEGMNNRAYTLAEAAYAFFAQRLVRLLCPECSVEAPKPSDDELMTLGVRPDCLPRFSKFETIRAKRKGGCPKCQGAGEKGRTGIYEALVCTAPVKEAIRTMQPAERLRQLQREQGGDTIFEQGIDLLGAGRISLTECMYLAQE